MDVFKTVDWLGRFMRDSNKRNHVLAEHQKLPGLPRLKLVESAFTRWLSHDQATNAISNSFVALLNTRRALCTGKVLPDTSVVEGMLPNFAMGSHDPPAEALYKIIATQDFIFFLSTLADFTILTIQIPIVVKDLRHMITTKGANATAAPLVRKAGHSRASRPSHSSMNDVYMEKNRVLILDSLADEIEENMTILFTMPSFQ
jgi:hypothetical protein